MLSDTFCGGKVNPFVLCKFRPINKWLVESLVNRSIYFAKPDTLNDPFDCHIDLWGALKRAELSATGDRKVFFSMILSESKFFENWKSILDRYGLCAFSRENTHTLLWSHYADEHRGVCLKYQFRPSYFLTEEFLFAVAGDVDYIDEPLTDWLKNSPTEINQFVEGLVHKYFKTKSRVWKYEKESRIIRRQHGVFSFNINEPFLNQVCFGLRTPQADIDLVTNLAQRYTGCTIFSQMVRDETEFGFTENLL